MTKVTITLDVVCVAKTLNAIADARQLLTDSIPGSTKRWTYIGARRALADLAKAIVTAAEAPAEESLEEKAFALMRAWGRTLAADEANEAFAKYGKDLISACGAAAALIDVLGMDNEDLMEAMDEGKAKERARRRAEEERKS